MVTLKGSLDILLQVHQFDKNFRTICWLVLDKLGDDSYYDGRTPQKLAYVIVSAVMKFYYSKSDYSPSKKVLRRRLGLSPTAAEYSMSYGNPEWAEFRQRIFKICNDMKAGKYD